MRRRTASCLGCTEFVAKVVSGGVDQHNRPVGYTDPDQVAMGWLWEEWRDDMLGALNGYREVWSEDDLLYDGSPPI